MELHRWMSIYDEIIEDMGFSRETDRISAEKLATLRGSDGLEPLKALRGRSVEILGPLVENRVAEVSVAAGSALEDAVEARCTVDLMVTDLDGDTGLQLEYNKKGTPAVIHAHGDNIDKIEIWAQRFSGHVVSTCQCEPPEGIYNFGGFTDGDRAVLLAEHFGAREIVLNGWDLDKAVRSSVHPENKAIKLRWARKIIEMVDTPLIWRD